MTTNRYYELEERRLLLESEKIALLTSHPSTLGSHREALLRAYLRGLTPRSLDVGSGFISDNSTVGDGATLGATSRQVDCLVFDAHRRAPLFSTPDFSVVDPEAVCAAIEVKSTLTLCRSFASADAANREEYPFEHGGRRYRWAGTLIDALVNIQSVARACENRDLSYLTGIFSFDCKYDPRKLYHLLDNGEIQKQLGIVSLRELPSYIYSLGGPLIALLPKDFTDIHCVHDSNMSFFNCLEEAEGSAGYPFRIFSTFYLSQINWYRHGVKSARRGLHGSGCGKLNTWSHHFDLRSDF